MGWMSRLDIRTKRLFAVVLAVSVYFLLLIQDAQVFFHQRPTAYSPAFLLWMNFGFSALIALAFLAVGALVWLYARNRRTALLLFCFCLVMMVLFAAETGALFNNLFLSAVSNVSSILSLLLFSALLFLFPKNYLSLPLQRSSASGSSNRSGKQYYYVPLVRGYLILLTLLSIIAVLLIVCDYSLLLPFPSWLNLFVSGYYLSSLAGIVVILMISSRQRFSLRERQQHRIFVSGVVLTFAPLLILTVLPEIWNPSWGVPGQFSTITFAILPLALGYSILRYQIRVLDTYIRRVIARLLGCISVAVLGCFVTIFSSVLFSNNTPTAVICAAFTMAAGAPCVWRLSQVAAERLLFSEIAYYRRLMDQTGILTGQLFHLDEIARLLAVAVTNAFGTRAIGLFVLNDNMNAYRPLPVLKDDDLNTLPHRHVVQQVLQALHTTTHTAVDTISVDAPVIAQLATTVYPLSLSEVRGTHEDLRTALPRYLITTLPQHAADPLLVPIRAQGRFIGFLVLGERADHQPYAGPDFEAMQLILARFASALETARLNEQARKRTTALTPLGSDDPLPGRASERMNEEVAGAEVWLYDETDRLLRRIIHLGSGSPLTPLESLVPQQKGDWSPWFYEGDSSGEAPPCLSQLPSFPFAWLPLKRAQREIGALVLTYPCTYVFC